MPSISEKIDLIVDWLTEYAKNSKTKGFVVGVSGGVDSAVTSTLCCMTGANVVTLSMPIDQDEAQLNRAATHMDWLTGGFNNACQDAIDLTAAYDNFIDCLPEVNDLAKANSRSRLRMVTLYAMANSLEYLVVGTGNKIEDYGIGFFTKYGDGGVDISPIGNLLKSEVYEIAQYLQIHPSILDAPPSDGLWNDGRTDEQQIGASYEELEWALNYYDLNGFNFESVLSDRQREVLKIYTKLHKGNSHKMLMPPVCTLSNKEKK